MMNVKIYFSSSFHQLFHLLRNKNQRFPHRCFIEHRHFQNLRFSQLLFRSTFHLCFRYPFLILRHFIFKKQSCDNNTDIFLNIYKMITDTQLTSLCVNIIEKRETFSKDSSNETSITSVSFAGSQRHSLSCREKFLFNL